jgi:hypothetical protein
VTLFETREGIPQHFGLRALKRSTWNIVVRVCSSITVMCWEDEREVHQTHLQLRGNFGVNPKIVPTTTHLSYVDTSDRMGKRSGINFI